MTSSAQIGIGTTSPNSASKLDITSTDKGLLIPRVQLTATNSTSPITGTVVEGLMVYNTASAGTGSTAVTHGFYYYDGAKWQRIINQQPDATVEFNTADPRTGSPTFTPNTPTSRDVIYVSTVDNSQWTYNGTTYVTYTPPASTAWYLSGGTSDGGSNKTGAVYRTGSVGIGATTTPNASAQLDVNSTSKGFLPPRMTTTERNAISSPATGLIIYNSTTGRLEVRTSSAWVSLSSLASSDVSGTLPVANGGTGVTTSTGTGSVVLSTSPTLTTPTIASGNQQFPSSLAITPTTHGTSTRASIWIDGWSLLQDVTGSGTKNFSIGQTVSGTYPSRLFISTSGDIGIGNTAPVAKLDVRTTPNSTTDPGAGYLGVGTTTTAANSAGAGAIRYNTGNGGALEYSNGSIWQPLAASKAKAVYTEVHTDAGSAWDYSANTPLNDFGTITADNVVAVYGSSYGFFNAGSGFGYSGDKWVAPFTGKFRVTTNAYFQSNTANPRLYAYRASWDGSNATVCNITSASNNGQDIMASTSAIISMNAGDIIFWRVEGSGARIYRGLYHTFFRIESVE